MSTADKVADSLPPDGAKILDTQVGGHRYGKHGRKMGMLDRGNGIVLKALQNPPRGTRELKLYQTTFAPSCKDKELFELRHFLPLYYGTEVIDEVTFLVMDNLVHRFPRPNVLDLKMGRVTWDPEASAEKKLHEESKYPPLKDLGFQLTGMMMHDPAKNVAEHFTKDYCRGITAQTMLTDGLGKFFGLCRPAGLRKDVVSRLLLKLRSIEAWFQVQHRYAFYASSLLIIYSSSEDSTRNSPPTVCSPLVAAETAELPPTPKSIAGADEKVTSASGERVCCSGSTDRTAGVKTGRVSQNGVSHTTEFASISNTTAGCGLKRTLDQSAAECRNSTGAGAGSESKQARTSDEGDRVVEGTVVPPENDAAVVRAPETSEVKVSVSVNFQAGLSSSPLVEVRMIDFAHVFPSTGGRDDNYLFGLQRLIMQLEQLLKM